MKKILSHADIMELQRWNTTPIYNGWEQITKHNSFCEGFNLEPVTDFRPQIRPMVGNAEVVVIEPENPDLPDRNINAWVDYWEYVASVPGPKILVVQDSDKSTIYGALWGEIISNIHDALGWVGTITDGGICDISEMNNTGIKALARGVCIDHAKLCPICWNCEVEVFGWKISPGQLIHADHYDYLVIPEKDHKNLQNKELH